MQHDKITSNYFPALTGIRTVAASMVFLAHFNPFNHEWFNKPLFGFVQEFHTGVTIFFVLSGFLICYRYYDRAALHKKWFREYLTNRFARIYPMYFILTVIVFLPFVCHCSFTDNLHILFLNLTFLRGFFVEYKSTGINPGWSLTVEELFYFLFPFIIVLSRWIRLVLQPLLFIGFGLLLWAIFRNISFHGFFSSLRFLFEFTFFGRCVEFYTGILLALYVKSGNRTAITYSGCYRTIGGILYIIVCIILLEINSWYNLGVADGTFVFYETLINNFLLPPGIAILFYGLLTERSPARSILASAPFVLMGKSSYIFYLVHLLVFGIFNAMIYRFIPGLPAKLVLIFILTQCTSILLYITVEKPLNDLIRHIGKKKYAFV